MRRTLAILALSCATALTAVSCGSATDDTLTAPTTAPGAAGKATTTAKPKTTTPAAGGVDAKKCTAIDAYLLSYLIAGKDDAKLPEKQAGVLKGITSNTTELKKALPQIAADIDVVTAYITKVVKGDATAAADKEKAEKAKNKIAFFGNSCKDNAEAAPKAPTTTAKK